MANSTLGKTSAIIGKSIFYFLVLASAFITISFNLSNLEEHAGISILIGSFLGNMLAIVLIYLFWRLWLKPIYSFDNTVNQKLNSQIEQKAYKAKWNVSLICSLLFGLLFSIGTFGISLLIMVPHYIFLSKTKKL
jgi:hypothetical protein